SACPTWLVRHSWVDGKAPLTTSFAARPSRAGAFRLPVFSRRLQPGPVLPGGLRQPGKHLLLSLLLHSFSRFLPRDKCVVGIVIFPLAVAAGQVDIMLRQPLPDHPHALRPAMIVHHVSVRQVALHGGPHWIFRLEESHFVAILNAPPYQVVALARQRLMLRVRDLARQAESARRIAIRAGVALHENPVKYRVFRIINPVLFR